ncbi:DUF805 domain-containing protein [Asaia sp. VD9]|uniref:DUF805 domain-containing protein n=1 Tax=Asaia sp. VD9 TaxID=3081235 RepID=UPI003016ADB6
MTSLLYSLKCAFHFSGRSSRSDYLIFTIAGWFFAGIFTHFSQLGALDPENYGPQGKIILLVLVILMVLALIYVAIAQLSLSVRRCHDCGWSGWAVLITLIPFVGVIVLMVVRGEDGENRYGKSAGVPWVQ